MKDSDWFIPVTIVPFHQYWNRDESRLCTFELTAKVIGASSSDPKTYSDVTSTFVVVLSSSSTLFTLAVIYYIKVVSQRGTILFLIPKLPIPPPPEAIITSPLCQANP